MNLRILLALLLIFAASHRRAVADEWISDEYLCAMTIPTQESWAKATRQALPNGEVIFHAASMTTNNGIMVTYVTGMPSSDLRNAALVKRINELIESQGWNVESVSETAWLKSRCLQIITRRRDTVAGRLVGVMRAVMRGRNLYVVTAYGKGEADRADDPEFMRVLETFHFIEKPTVIVEHQTPSPGTYKLASLAAAGCAAFALLAYVAAYLRLRLTSDEHH